MLPTINAFFLINPYMPLSAFRASSFPRTSVGYLIVLAHLLCACTPDLAPAPIAIGAPLADKIEGPNILLIVADDLGWADLNCYGSYLIESSNIDRLARDGLQFMQGYAAAPGGSSSRASIQTGLYPARTGLTGELTKPAANSRQKLIPPRTASGLAARFTTLGEVAKGAGYRTAHVGKWGLGGGKFSPEKQAYDVTYASGAQAFPESFYHPFFSGEPFPELAADTEPGDYLTDALTDKTIDLMDDWAGDPWFISLNYYAPHVPIEGRKDWVNHYRDLIDSTHRRAFPILEYAAMVSTLDENVGRLLTHLEASDQLENTLIIFVSDNGGLHVRADGNLGRYTPPTDNGILRGGKGHLHEGGIRVPFILHYPAGVAGTNASSTPVITNDILPTVAAAVGNPRAYNGADGVNLLPLLTGGTLPARNLYWYFPHYSAQGGTPAAAVRSGNFKLYLDYENDSTTYYNLATFPDESLMLATPPERPPPSKSPGLDARNRREKPQEEKLTHPRPIV
ncbi:sulfatase [Neolewinella antarctica]|uniref:Arylsulfatase A-like enzyme n=1 Tax=Neolewinella antarctica TaxID=442734 RepID=A0ABX0XCU3_9BACT|nr:sulfatase [Neolewinella antarctica]NJC26729.1 arylsulfatase A-like enzyme [Neolewinella antarctica]